MTPPIHLSTTFERHPDGDYPLGFSYAREGNPARRSLEECLAALEGGKAALAFSSGLAVATVLLQGLEPIARARGVRPPSPQATPSDSAADHPTSNFPEAGTLRSSAGVVAGIHDAFCGPHSCGHRSFLVHHQPLVASKPPRPKLAGAGLPIARKPTELLDMPR